MTKLTFNKHIQAPTQKVWEALWQMDNYSKWTSAFADGSHAITDNWKEGSKVHFLDGQGHGMFSIIEKNIPHQQMTFKHLGDIKNGQEIVTSWSGAIEDYQLKETEDGTDLIVSLDMTEEFEPYFKETFPKALAVVKEIAEQ